MKIEKISDSLGWRKKEIEQKTIDAVAASRAHLSLSLSLSLFLRVASIRRIDSEESIDEDSRRFVRVSLGVGYIFFSLFFFIFFYNVRDFRFAFFFRVVRLLLICQRRRRVTSSTILFCFVFFVSSFLFLPSKLSPHTHTHTHTHQSIC